MVAGVWQLCPDLVHLGSVHPDSVEDARARDWWASSCWEVVSPSWVSAAFPTCLESAAFRTRQGAPVGPGTFHRSPLIHSSGLLFSWWWGLPGQRPLHGFWDALLGLHLLSPWHLVCRRSHGSTCPDSNLGILPAEPPGLPQQLQPPPYAPADPPCRLSGGKRSLPHPSVIMNL